MDHRCNIVDPLAIRAGEQLYDGRLDPYTIGNRGYHGCRQSHSGAAGTIGFIGNSLYILAPAASK